MAEPSGEEVQRIMVMASLNAEVAQPRRNREAGGARPVAAPWVYLAHRGDKETRRFGPASVGYDVRAGWPVIGDRTAVLNRFARQCQQRGQQVELGTMAVEVQAAEVTMPEAEEEDKL